MEREPTPRTAPSRGKPPTLAIVLGLPALALAGTLFLSTGEGREEPDGTAAAPAETPREGSPDRLAALLSAHLDREPDGPLLGALAGEEERRRVEDALRKGYEELGYRPVWIRDGRPTDAARELVETLRRAPRDGLVAESYHPGLLERRLGGLAGDPAPERVIEADALLSRALLVYGEHLATGRVDPRSLGPAWLIEPRDPDLTEAFRAVERTGEASAAIARLRPPHPGYDDLREALARYRELARSGGWTEVPEGPVLAAGDMADPERLRALARRLEAEGDLDEGAWAPERAGDGSGGARRATYDETLAAAVERFQQRLGLTVDSKVGPETTAALNRPASHRVRQIELNLERWRWLPTELGERRIEVNLPAFLLHTVEGDRTTSTMKVVVGETGAATPAFSDRMSYVVINPYWNVPDSIVAAEIAPEVIEDPGYLAEHGYEVVSGWSEDARVVDPSEVDWQAARDGGWEHRLRQRPGPDNALGRIKFMFPNDHDIYLHDTPAKHLFAEAERTFSHGCIRVERPLDLAGFAFRGDPEWTASRIRSVISSGEHRRVGLPAEIPVYLLYWTAWVDEAGTVHFREDVYGHDRALAEALDRAAPEPPDDRLAR